eukprot:g29765.t1
MSDRVPFIVQYFLGVEKLYHVLCSLQHIIDDDEHPTKIFHMLPFLTFKQRPNLIQTIVRSKLPSLQDNIDHNTIQHCFGNLYKTCQIIDMDTTITLGNTTYHMHGRYSCDSAKVVYLICCRQGCSEVWCIGKIMQTLRQRMNVHRATIANQACSLPVGEHFSSKRHLVLDLRVNFLHGRLRDAQQLKADLDFGMHNNTELIAKFGTDEDGFNQDLGFMAHD